MSRSLFCVLVVLASVSSVRAEKPSEKKPEVKPLLETWQAAYFEGLKVGHVHTLARQTGMGDDLRIHTVRTMQLTIKRYGSVMPINIEQSSIETSTGKVLALGLTQQIGDKDPKTTFSGRVVGANLLLRVNDGDDVRKLPFDDNSLGLYAQEAIFQKKKSKPGDKLALVSYEILLGGTLTIRATVKDREKVDRLVEKKGAGDKVGITREPATLLRVDTMPDPVFIGTTRLQLPGKTVWLDAKLMPQREQFAMPGFSTPITLYTTTKKAALEEGVAPDRLPDFGLNINIPVKYTIDDPYRTRKAVYRITLAEKLDQVFTSDDRQSKAEEKDNTFELTVQTRREPGTDVKATPPGKEYLESNVFIDSDDERIQNLSRALTGKVVDPWKKALVLEKWVHDNMKVSSAVGFPSASKICKDREGDCRQHSLLLVALCRAAGIPARTAIGLIYAREPGRSPFFGFHMWGEVWVRGKWVPLDAILGEGGVAATHLKMGDHSWSKTQTLAPLLPISQTLGKIKIEVLSAK